jgi:hypothetical protein
MEIHIGDIIKRTLRQKNITVIEFASKINCTTGNVYKIFQKHSIDTNLLTQINKALGENLFLHFVAENEVIGLEGIGLRSSELISTLKDLKTVATWIEEEKEKKKQKRKLGKAVKKKASTTKHKK